MNQLERLEGDLRFVRGALESSDKRRSPAVIYFLWAAAVLVGFVLVDFSRALVPLYWTVVGPTGAVASFYLGWRYARRTGQASVSEGRRYALHWGGMLVAIAFAVLMQRLGGGLSWEGLNAVILLILALGYFTAGVHIDRPLMWVGALMGVGYIVVTLVSAYAWTMVGIALAIALTIAGLRGGRSLDAAK